ncbi:MAG: hypothetical protein ACRD3E_10365 [Terriglobales bacterium]
MRKTQIVTMLGDDHCRVDPGTCGDDASGTRALGDPIHMRVLYSPAAWLTH